MSYNAGLPIKFYGVSHVTASLSSKHPQLGAETFDSDGNKYVWAYNDCNSEIGKGFGCVLQSGVSTAYSMTLSAATSADFVVGVVKHTSIPTGNYGWLLTRGGGVAEMGATSGSVASRGLIEIGANGVWVPVSNTTGNKAAAVGQALAAIVSSASGSAYFSVY